jgi:Resolvase, N terminal domain/Helix-turn-helix domain of resolvase
LLNTLHAVGKKGAGFKSLADAWADTTTPHGRLMLTILGGLAEFERELIRARTGEGRARAKAKGIHMGRPSKLNQHQRQEAIERLERGDTLMDIARTYGVSHTTILRLRPFVAAGAVYAKGVQKRERAIRERAIRAPIRPEFGSSGTSLRKVRARTRTPGPQWVRDRLPRAAREPARSNRRHRRGLIRGFSRGRSEKASDINVGLGMMYPCP